MNIFTLNIVLLSFTDTYLLRSKHEPLSLTEEFLTGLFLRSPCIVKEKPSHNSQLAVMLVPKNCTITDVQIFNRFCLK